MTKNIYFHAGGFYAMPHYFGAIKQLERRDYVYYGNSAGSSWALVCYLVLNGYVPMDAAYKRLLDVFNKPRPLSCNLAPIYLDLLDVCSSYWPSDLAKRVSGILHVGVSTKDGHKFISNFSSNYDLYNALMCSGTIVGCSDYKSTINGETCLDGGYTFTEDKLPDDTLVIVSDVRFPLALTTPPDWICPWLQENGKINVKHGLQTEICIHEHNPTFMKLLFAFHKLTKKNPEHKKRITGSGNRRFPEPLP